MKTLLGFHLIVSLRYSEWVANLVPVQERNVEIQLCVDFQNLNKVLLNGNYFLIEIDHMLQLVVKEQRISMMDLFFWI